MDFYFFTLPVTFFSWRREAVDVKVFFRILKKRETEHFSLISSRPYWWWNEGKIYNISSLLEWMLLTSGLEAESVSCSCYGCGDRKKKKKIGKIMIRRRKKDKVRLSGKLCTSCVNVWAIFGRREWRMNIQFQQKFYKPRPRPTSFTALHVNFRITKFKHV